MKPSFYTIAAKGGPDVCGKEVTLPDYSAPTELQVKSKVLAIAQREGYTGKLEDRMISLGWKIIPAYTSLPEPAITSDDLKAVLDLLAVMHGDGGHYAAKHGIAKAAKDALRPGTPAAKWRADGMPDPHGDLYNCERADLAMGNYTDDELANAVFLHGDSTQVISGEIMPIAVLTAAKDRIRWLSRALVAAQAKARPNSETMGAYEFRVANWMDKCFLPSLYSNMTERGDRLLEEVLELLQSGGYDRNRVATLVEYVYGRPVGDPEQEVGGVMVTLAGYCYIAKIPMAPSAWDELRRVEQPAVMDRIRAKQQAKNAIHFDTPLPGNAEVQS